MKRRTAVLFALLLSFALLSWWLALDSPDSADDPIATAPPQPPAAPAIAHPPKPEPEPAPEPALTPQLSPPTPPPPAAPTPQLPIAPDTRGFTDALQGRFEADPRDSGAGETEAAIRKLYRAPRMPSGLLRGVLCREAVCKLDLHWTAEHDKPYREVLDYLADGNAKLVATRAGAPDKNGAVDVEAYWIRRPLSD